MISGDKVVGYVRVSTTDQGVSGYSIDAQTALIESERLRRGWTVVEIFKDVASAATTRKRPGYDGAVAACERGDAQGIVAAKLDRISRSVLDFGALLAQAQAKHFNVCVLDIDLDLSGPVGEAIANVMVAFAQLERRLIGQRTIIAMAMARKRGVHCGRPRILTANVVNNWEEGPRGSQSDMQRICGRIFPTYSTRRWLRRGGRYRSKRWARHTWVW